MCRCVSYTFTINIAPFVVNELPVIELGLPLVDMDGVIFRIGLEIFLVP